MTAAEKHERYRAARADAQARANESGFDHGLEYNSLFHTFRVFLLPRRANRAGFELRCEVVMCDHIDKQQPGHGFK